MTSPITTLIINGTPVAVVPDVATEGMRSAQAEWVTAVSKWRAMLAAADPSLTEAVIEMRRVLGTLADAHELALEEIHPPSERERAESVAFEYEEDMVVVKAARATLSRITIQETSDEG